MEEIKEVKQEKNNRIKSLDGLRFLAITLVVASHSGFLLQGGLGNDIFFALSGFLAVSPFKDAEVTSLLKNKYLLKFYAKKILRIIPAFWIYLFFSFIFFNGFVLDDFNSYRNLFMNMFFIRVDGHLWFLQQEMLFYLVVPFILFLVFIIKNILEKHKCSKVKSNLVITILLFISSYFAIKYFPNLPIRLKGNGGEQYLRLGFFFAGMTSGYFYKTYDASEKKIRDDNKLFRFLCNLLIISFIVFCIASSSQVLEKFDPTLSDYHIGWTGANICIIFTSIIMFVLVISKDTFMGKFMGNKFFCYISKISFCMYLFHWRFLLFKHENVFLRFLLIYFVTISVSILINKFIEEPSLKLAKKIKY